MVQNRATHHKYARNEMELILEFYVALMRRSYEGIDFPQHTSFSKLTHFSVFI